MHDPNTAFPAGSPLSRWRSLLLCPLTALMTAVGAQEVDPAGGVFSTLAVSVRRLVSASEI